MAKKAGQKQSLLRDMNGVLYVAPAKEAKTYLVTPKQLPAVLGRAVKARTGKRGEAATGGKVNVKDLAGLLYSVPAGTAAHWRVAPAQVPQILKVLAKEMPKTDWKKRLAPKPPVSRQVPPKAIDIGISAVTNIGVAEGLEVAHNCCIKDCCVMDCCVAECKDFTPDPCPRDCHVQDPYHCRPVE